MNVYASTPPGVTKLLAPDERVVWTGRPPTGLRFRKADVVLVPFSILWGGFACVWEVSVFATNAPVLFKLWGLPLVCVGVYTIAGRFFVDAYLRARTAYAVTDRAAYVVRTDAFPAVRRFAGSALDAVSFEASSNGSGTVRFSPAFTAVLSSLRGWGTWNGASLEAFQNVPNVLDVYRNVVAIRDGTPAGGNGAT